MRNRWSMLAACLLSASLNVHLAGQGVSLTTDNGLHVCACGAHPPAPPRDRAVEPYAGEPADLRPYAKFAAPYASNYTHPNIYSGAARDIPDPQDLSEIRVGFLGPIEHNPQSLFGQRMLHGAQLALEDANARGGYGGKPFRLMPHNDYDNWQANSAYGDDRPTDSAIWGSASNEVVKMVYDEKDWAIFGSISAESTHIALRVALRAEIPIVNSASTDPTIPETYVPWYFTNIQDDRVQSFTLARRIFTELGLKRVALLRINDRYGRLGVPNFRDAARRLGHPVVIEQKFLPGDTDFARQLNVIRSSRADALVLWADEAEAAMILKQMRAAGMKQPVFGSHRTLGTTLLQRAGAAAEGFQAVFPYNPSSRDPKWLDFNRRFEVRFHQEAEQFAALAYDAMSALLDSICAAGLNRARIHDALADIEDYQGVTGHMTFDPNQKNVAPMYLGTVHDGVITYSVATMEAGQAEPRNVPPHSQEGVSYLGTHSSDIPTGPADVVLFGPQAEQIAETRQMQAQLNADGRHWALVPVSSDQSWGAASTQLVHALVDGHALAIIALDRNSSHLAEQLALRCFVPVVALSSDKTLTSSNIPWIFRMPSDAAPADAIRLLEAAAGRVTVNGQRAVTAELLRDVLRSGDAISGMAFQPTGEPLIP